MDKTEEEEGPEELVLQGVEDPAPPPDYDTAVVIQKNNFFPDAKLPADADSLEDPPAKVSLLRVFAFASPLDLLLICVGVLSALACGSIIPFITVRFGDILQVFVDQAVCKKFNVTMKTTLIGLEDDDEDDYMDDMEMEEDKVKNPLLSLGPLPPVVNLDACLTTGFMDEMKVFSKKVVTLAFTLWVGSYLFVTCLNYAAERQVFRIRLEFLKSILRQDLTWYDTRTSSDYATRLTEDLNKLQEGIGEKIGMLCFLLSTFVLSIVTAFLRGWQLTLLLLSMIPMMGLCTGFLAKIQASYSKEEMTMYAKAGSYAEEVLANIKTVVAFGGEEKESDAYKKLLKPAKRSGIMRNALTGASGGITFIIMYSVYGVAFWYGLKLIFDDLENLATPECRLADRKCERRFSPETLVVVFFSLLMGGFQIGQTAPYIEAVASARGAASNIFGVIGRWPPINSGSERGMRPVSVDDNIVVRGLSFSYPTRKTVPILTDLSFEVRKGQTVAIVGPSGCGKSTVLQLLQRFYDPDLGYIELDGKNIKHLNVGWMRDRIGVVGQEPVLFDLSILENIRVGRTEVTQDEVVKAAKEANAFDFIMKLPKRFDTLVGENGAQLSGGQKQRIAIARALVRNPQILLLDEATSALDTESEGYVQAALEKARCGRTTIIVAQRLSTVRNADKILVLKAGRVEEEGNHNELLAKSGLYYNLVKKQSELNLPGITDGETATVPENTFGDDVEAVGAAAGAREGRESRSSALSELVVPDDVIREIAEREAEELPKLSLWRVLKINAAEWPFILLGILSSIAMGAVAPAFALLFGDVLDILSWEDIAAARNQSKVFSFLFLGLGLSSGVVMFLQGLMFGISGEQLTMRLRTRAFSSMLRQEMGWFDLPNNSTGALCTRLSNDAAMVQGATGARIGSVLQGLAGFTIAIALGIYYNWKLGLVAAAFLPLMIGAAFLHMEIIMGVGTVQKKALEKASKLAVEAITNIRTVASSRSEESFLLMFLSELREPHHMTLNKAHIRGFIFGFSQAIQFFSWAACVYVGGYLINTDEMTFDQVFKVACATIGGTSMIGYSFAFTSDFQKALSAASAMIQILDKKSKIPADASAGLQLPNSVGSVTITDAEFSYPTRPDIRVLNRLIISIKSGEKVALVGQSGCGKSTVIQLIQRLYDLDEGSIQVEQQEVEGLNLPWLRSQVGLVSQEPVLFDRTIAENISYGDNSREIDIEEVPQQASAGSKCC